MAAYGYGCFYLLLPFDRENDFSMLLYLMDVQVGDQLIEINGISTKNMAHADAIELIKNGGLVVRLLLRRGNIAPPMGNNKILL